MSIRPLGTSVLAVTDVNGERIRARRAAIGMSISALAKRAGVDRGSLTALEAGERVRDTTVSAVVRTLAELEHEIGMDEPTAENETQGQPIGDPAEDLIEISIDGNFGVRAVVKGPVRDLPALQDAVSKIIADMQHRAEVREQD